MVHDLTGRRVLLFDSTLTKVEVVADTTGAAANAYTPRLGGLIAYRGDSTLFVDPTALTMSVLDPNGAFIRNIAVPRAREARNLIGGPFGTPGFDAQGRLVFRATGAATGAQSKSDGAASVSAVPDSAPIVRFDFVRRVLDTVTFVRIPKVQMLIGSDPKGRSTFTTIIDPMPVVDDWGILADGTIAVVRGRLYRVEMYDSTKRMSSGPKLAFDWERMTDESKGRFVDSMRVVMIERTRGQGSPAGGMPDGMEFVSPSELPDYRPAFQLGAARGDRDGNLWVRTTKVVDGGSVYDVINRAGDLVDRVAVPAGRIIAGFGPRGVVYMGVVDGATTRVERAQAH